MIIQQSERLSLNFIHLKHCLVAKSVCEHYDDPWLCVLRLCVNSGADFPKSYTENCPDEKHLLFIANSFQRHFSLLYPDRKPLLLCPVNECGVQVRPPSHFHHGPVSSLYIARSLVFLFYRNLCRLRCALRRQDSLTFSPGKSAPALSPITSRYSLWTSPLSWWSVHTHSM